MIDTEIHRFSNGLRLVLENLPGSKSAGVAVGFPVGGRTEDPSVSGISHYLEHMIFKGTGTIKNVDAAFQKLGAKDNAMTEVDTTVYVAECPREYLIKALDLWLHLLSQASIEPQDLERERGVILSEYFITEDSLDYLVEKTATQTLFKDHPLSTTVIGSEETIGAITRSKMHRYFRSLYNPSDAVIWVSGDLSMKEIVDCVRNNDTWTRQVRGPTVSRKAFHPPGPSVTELRRPVKLLQVGLALSCPTRSAEERASIQILGSMLSAGRSSILRRRLVLETELTDKLRTLTPSYEEAGMLLTSFATRPNKAVKVVDIIAETLNELREDTDKFKELFENARNHAIGLLTTSLDTTMMYRVLQGSWETLRRGHCSWDELIHQLCTLSFDQFKENVLKISSPERTALIMAGAVREGVARTLDS
jgi:predicted Zn-dependent peptidase